MRVVEGTGRALGFTPYGGHIMAAAGKQSANMLSRYTGKSFTTDDLKPHHEALKAPVKNVWDVIDRAAYVTLPGVISAATVVGAAGLGAGVRVVEGAGRTLGFTPYGGHIMAAAGKQSANMLSRYTGKSFTTDDLKPHHEALKAPVKNVWDVTDRAAYVTLPGAIAAATVVGAAGLGAGVRVVEGTGRALGFTPYGGHIMAAAGKQSANMLSRYTGKSFTTDDLKPHHEALKAPVKNVWDVTDRAAYVTLPGAIAAATVVGAAGLGAGLRVVEGTGRVLGLTPYGGHILAAASMRSANMLSRYTGKTFVADDLKPHHDALGASIKNGWDVADRAAYVTLPGALALTEVVGAAGLSLGLHVGEGLGRALGFSEYGSMIIKAAGMHAANISSRYTSKLFGTYDEDKVINPLEQMIFSLPKDGWSIADRGGLITLPALVAATEILGSLLLTGSLGTVESVGRCMGISERSKNLFLTTMSKVGNMYGVASGDDIKEKEQSIGAKPKSAWEVLDCVGLVPSAVATGIVGGLSAIPAVIGFSKSNWHRANYRWEHGWNIIKDRRGETVDRTKETYHKEKLVECENTSTVGKVASKLNVFNVAAEATTFAVGQIAAPVLYGTVRTMKHIVKNLCGIIPAIKAIHKCFSRPPHIDMNDPFNKIAKRFDDLRKALNVSGHLPVAEGVNDLRIESVNAAIEEANKRSVAGRAKFGLFTEGRKILNVGHTLEEKVISEFRDKFDEFKRICKRRPDIKASNFFNNDIPLENGKRFSYNAMVEHIKGFCFSIEDKQKVDRIAQLIKSDIEKEIAGVPGPVPSAPPAEEKSEPKRMTIN